MKKLYTLTLCLVLLVLATCSGDNLFGNPSPDKDDSVKSLRLEAESAFRKGDYKGSYSLCSLIVAKEPSMSFGYFGMAKAGLWMNAINPLSLFSLVKIEKDQCPFMGETAKVQNNYLQAMKRVEPVLSELNRRDTLTTLYELYTAAKKNGLSLDSKLSDFGNTFCGNTLTCKDTASKKELFPLSDREYKKSYFGNILLLSSFSKSILSVISKNGCIAKKYKRDANGNPIIDPSANPGDPETNASKWKEWGCQKDSVSQKFEYSLSILLTCPIVDGKMTVSIDPNQILDDLKNELDEYYNCIKDPNKDPNKDCVVPDGINDINDKLDNFGDDFKDMDDVLSNLGVGGGDSEGGSSIKDEIDKYKAYATFYKIGTHIDEDGDGCIDEDLLDNQDNDGDGLPNANARLAPVDPSNVALFGYNIINNSMKGDNPYMDADNWNNYNKPIRLPAPVKICNNKDCTKYRELWGDPDTELATVILFTQEPAYWTTDSLELKLAIAQDTACPPKYDLDYRKNNVGGCWPNYDNNKFVKYWLKRELANNPDRVHPSCKQCNGEDCLK